MQQKSFLDERSERSQTHSLVKVWFKRSLQFQIRTDCTGECFITEPNTSLQFMMDNILPSEKTRQTLEISGFFIILKLEQSLVLASIRVRSQYSLAVFLSPAWSVTNKLSPDLDRSAGHVTCWANFQ